MRRALLTTTALGAMLVGAAAPASAAPPERMKESGSYTSFSSYTVDCEQQGNRSTCTELYLDAFTAEDGSLEVCVYTRTYVVSQNRETTRSAEFGCSTTDASALTVTEALYATLAPTTVILESETGGGTREITVSAQHSPIGPSSTATGRGTFTEDNCTFRFSYTEQFAQVAGTITVDGVTLDESGFVATGENTVMSRCR